MDSKNVLLSSRLLLYDFLKCYTPVALSNGLYQYDLPSQKIMNQFYNIVLCVSHFNCKVVQIDQDKALILQKVW
jgi:hypothetical protein